MKYLLVLILSLPIKSLSQHKQFKFTGGTTNITLVTKDSIWMAADSKISSPAGDSIGLFCKIVHVNNVIYTISGAYVWISTTLQDTFPTSPDTLFDCYALLRQILLSTNSIDKCYERFNEIATPLLTRVFNLVKNEEGQDDFSKRIDFIFEIVMAGFNKDSLEYKCWNYTLKNKEGIPYVISTEFPRRFAYPFVHVGGFQDGIRPKLKENPNYITDGNIKERLTELIELSINENSKNVGLPINIIMGYKNGYKWLTDNKICN